MALIGLHKKYYRVCLHTAFWQESIVPSESCWKWLETIFSKESFWNRNETVEDLRLCSLFSRHAFCWGVTQWRCNLGREETSSGWPRGFLPFTLVVAAWPDSDSKHVDYRAPVKSTTKQTEVTTPKKKGAQQANYAQKKNHIFYFVSTSLLFFIQKWHTFL